MKNILERELVEFGLSEKAARVYLASLELGPSSAQKIAEKADVNRPTTYVMIESLTDSGLMSSFQKGKRRYYSAEEPSHLISIIKEKKREVENKENRISRIMDDLNALKALAGETPNVSYYEGIAGINALREDIIKSQSKEIRELIPLDEVRKFIPEDFEPEDLRRTIIDRLKVKSLYTSERGEIYKNLEEANVERKFLSKELFPVSCEVVIYGKKTAFLSFSGKPAGFLVEDESVSQTMAMLFDTLWAKEK